MKSGLAADLVTLMFYAAVLYLLTKPGSLGASAIQTSAQALAGLISTATAPIK